jgi:tetratricopeptide (TPR) repeat protein
MLYRMEWKWKEARSALQHAIRLKPDNAIAHLYYSQFLSSLSEYPEALQQIDLAITLNPAVPSMYYHRASCLSWYGKYKEALETSQKIQTLSPDYYSAYFQQAWLYHVMGEDKKAAESFKKAYIYSDEVKIFADSVVPAYEKGGWKGLVRLRIRIEMAEKSVSNFAISKLYMELEEYERALKYLALAVENNDRGLPQIISGEIFKPLHGDPRFESIRKKVAQDKNMTYR